VEDDAEKRRVDLEISVALNESNVLIRTRRPRAQPKSDCVPMPRRRTCYGIGWSVSDPECSLGHSAPGARCLDLRMVLFPHMPPRRYVICPRCASPHAFITLERTDTECSFCPMCRHVWDTRRTAANEAILRP
jgi:hypothetical protein